MKRFLVALACVPGLFSAAFAASSSADTTSTRLLRFPDIHGDRVVFTYGGDLWSVASSGGTAVRLTSNPGLELFGKFSPDGTQLAFTAQYGGDEQVYVMPASGGLARQLTFYPAIGPRPDRWGYDDEVYGWTPDGKSVLFRSQRDGAEYTDAKLYTVPATGGNPVALPMPQSGAGDFSPDGRKLVYSPLWRDFRTWKRYQGGWAQDLYIFDLDKLALTRVTDDPHTDRDPMWIGNAIWFVSDRDGHLNLFHYDVAAATTTQATHYTEADVRWASADESGQIVYELAGVLHVYDTRTAQDRALEIRVPDDGSTRRPERIAVKDNIESVDLSPGAERIAIVARGDLFTVPVKDGITRNLTQSSNAHDRESGWSHDGRQLVYISDKSGEEELWIATHDGSSAPRQLTKNTKTRYYAPRWAPDDAHIAVADKDGRLLLVDAKDGRITLVADDPHSFSQDHAWSPDGKYLAYSLNDANSYRGVYIYDVARATSHRVTPELFDAGTPAWDPKGEVLYFLSQREFQPQISALEWDFAANRGTGIFAVTLTPKVKNPFGPKNDEVGGGDGQEKSRDDAKDSSKDADKGKTKDKAKDKSASLPKVSIDFNGIMARTLRVPIDADNYSGLVITPEQILTLKSDAFYYGRDSAAKPALLAFSFEKRKSETVAEDVQAWSVSADGKKALVQLGDKSLKVLAVGGDNKDAEAVKLDGLALTRIPEQEWNEIFNEAWRRFRDYFYVENMHGYDWEALRARYQPLVKSVAHRADLNYIIGEMIGELSVSHAYIVGGDFRLPQRPFVALPGARFELDAASNRYRISQIFAGENEEPRYRSPLTEVGVDVKVGDYVLAINGRELTGGDNPWELSQTEAGQLVEWKVASRADGKDARVVRFEPLARESDLLYLKWVQANRARVDAATNGRVGYIHIPDMGENGIREFVKWWFPQLRKEALIVDVRANGGGNISAMIIDRLSRKLLGLDYPRGESSPITYPQQVVRGPMVALINETSASDGDIFPWQFRNAGLGELIGKRTWGGVIGINDHGPLLDGGEVFVPQYGTADAKGQWAVEGHGVDPDIVVEQDPVKVLEGGDPQLERGIAEILRQLPATAQDLPKAAPAPVKTP
ncbi:MAG: S41 family peptidase [Steroidobacteraceae bacterium]